MMEYLEENVIEQLLKEYGVGFRERSDPFFDEGNKLVEPIVKQGIIIFEEDEESCHELNEVFCNVPNCTKKFDTIFEFEAHYSLQHRFTCSECKKNLPSAHLLDLHLSETHDSFFAVQSEKKPMFACFNEECSHKSVNSDQRRDHCMTEHRFPQHFRFDRPRKIQNADKSSTAMDVDIKGSSSSSKPKTNYNFGHNKKKAIRSFWKKDETSEVTKKTNILEDDQMVVDLLKSLPD